MFCDAISAFTGVIMSEKFKKQAMRFDRDFQHGVLNMMLNDPIFCHKCSEFLDGHHFADSLSWFYDQIADYYREKGHVPTKDHLSAQISYFDSGKDGYEKMAKYSSEMSSIYAKVPDEDTIKKNMTNFIRANIFVEAASHSVMLYNQKDQEEAYFLLREKMEMLHKADFQKDRYSRFGDHLTILAQAHAETQGAIKTGMSCIDNEIKGLMPGTFTVFLGASNAGKSMVGPALAKQAALQKKKTFVTIHEDEEIPTKLRFLACFANISINKLMYGASSLTEEELKILSKADETLRQYVVLRFMYTTEATIENVMDVARSLRREWPYDLLICDYGQCLSSDQHKRLETRHLHEYIYHMLKQLCLELNIAGAGGAQVNRSGMAANRAGGEFLRCTDISEAYGIIKKATNVITLNRSSEDIKRNRIVFLLDKARNGKCPTAVEMVSNFANGIAYDPNAAQGPVALEDGPSKPQSDGDSDASNQKPKESYGTVKKLYEGRG